MATDLTFDQLLTNLSVKIPAPPGTKRENATPEMLITADEARAIGRFLASIRERLDNPEGGGTPTPGALGADNLNNTVTFTPASGTAADYGFELLP